MSQTFSEADFDEFEQLFDLRLEAEKRHQVWEYWQLIRSWNRKVRLTSIGDLREALQIHFFESFWVAEHFLQGMRYIADVGSGAGFPGLAIKLYRPDLRAVLLESNQNKAIFLAQAALKLGLQAEVYNGPAEEFQGWKEVDAALIRALRPSRRLVEILRAHQIPLIHLHGTRSEIEIGLHLETRLKIPGSRNRMASRYQAS